MKNRRISCSTRTIPWIGIRGATRRLRGPKARTSPFGIHLIFATQRPDANVIPGQIKNNMDFRVCGKADNVLSQIILDNTSAADRIPKDSQGRFITADGIVFQAYLFDEGQL